MQISGLQAGALIDTGCYINLCRSSFLAALENVHPIKSSIILSGPANVTFRKESKVSVDLEVDSETYMVDLYAVPDSAIMCDVIIGRTLFQTFAELHLKPDEIRITR